MDRPEPLASRLRPKSLHDFVGQRHLLAPSRPLHAVLKGEALHSLILWGPPGSGKTTLAELLARAHPSRRFVQLSAVLTGVSQLREALAGREPTLLFIDEIHRWSRSQQELLLPLIERGEVVLIGATTSSPFSTLTPALLSRLRIYRLRPLSEGELSELLSRAEAALGIEIAQEARRLLVGAAGGDGRRLLNLLEVALPLAEGKRLEEGAVREALSEELPGFDRGDLYDHLSALQKAIRGSDPDAALYWLCRMAQAGCDLRLAARRLVVIASEDVGNADPRALEVAVSAAEAYERLGSPEGELPLAQVVVYLALAPKSNAVYTALKRAREVARKTAHLPVPPHLRHPPRAPYRYPHDDPEGYAPGVHYFPLSLKRQRFYFPTERGFESKLRQKLSYLEHLEEKLKGSAES